MPTVYWGPNPGGVDLFVRTSVDPAGLAQVLRHEIEAVDPNEIKVLQIRTMEQIVAERGADSRFRALMVILFAVLATGITCLGLFGVLTYALRRTARRLLPYVRYSSTEASVRPRCWPASRSWRNA